MDFARKLLNKYGWKEGEGLGKHSDGIVKPLKASMKFDNAGLGSDQAASEFNNHWWERVFNEAAGNLDVKSDDNGVSMDLRDEADSVEISTKGYSLKKLKKAKISHSSGPKYDNFLKSATLTKSGDEIENPNKISFADISVTQYKILTDEEIFRACGGRTAHKGARHGLKLSGKLSRIEQQEKELLAKMQKQRTEHIEQFNKQALENVELKTKNKKDDSDDNYKLKKGKSLEENKIYISAKKKCKLSKIVLDNTKDLKKTKNFGEISAHIDSPIKKKRKKSKAENTHQELRDIIEDDLYSIDEPIIIKSKNKYKASEANVERKNQKKLRKKIVHN